jgi:hypothetical protein
MTFALLYRLIARRSQNVLVAIGLTVLAASGSTIHWLARPHLVTMLFTVIYLSILQRVQEGRTKLLWLLPLMAIVWTNLHGGFVFGIVIVGLVGAGELAGALLAATAEERWKAVRASIPYFAAAAGCLAASLVNPYTYHLHQHRGSICTTGAGFFDHWRISGATSRELWDFFELMLLAGRGLVLSASAFRGSAYHGWAHFGLGTATFRFS